MTFQIQPRRAIYIYINNIRHAQQLKKFGQDFEASKAFVVAIAKNLDDANLKTIMGD